MCRAGGGHGLEPVAAVPLAHGLPVDRFPHGLPVDRFPRGLPVDRSRTACRSWVPGVGGAGPPS
ncbi:hypothetical protein ABZ038_33430 [Streptomyces sp. NPDC006349]|uniref:hypothetical protein n=1 Tax=Streptomyces sp. NPDC006349 TaxID=3156757 RepID=UPI00339EC865